MRRDSIEAGTFEDAFFSRPSKGETDRIYKRAAALSAGRANLRARIAHEEREPTPREAAILRFSRNTLAVLEALLRIARVQAGRVYPTLEYLAETVGIGRRTVIRALALLTELGFVLAQRRFKRVEIDGVGPRYKQTSNAYRMLMPALDRGSPSALAASGSFARGCRPAGSRADRADGRDAQLTVASGICVGDGRRPTRQGSRAPRRRDRCQRERVPTWPATAPRFIYL